MSGLRYNRPGLKVPLLAVLALNAAPIPAAASTLGETFTCSFGRYGKVIIDTRYPGATITVNGKKHPASDGSYFYQADEEDIILFFGPNMKFWDYNDIRDNKCIRKKNMR